MEVERQQIEGTKALRRQRDAAAAERTLGAVRAAARNDKVNLMPPIIDAVKAGVTLGEICQVFRDEMGEHRDPAFV